MAGNITKDVRAPPSYEEVMQTPPQIGVYQSIGYMNAPPTAPHIDTAYVPSYGSFETPPVSVVVSTAPIVQPEIIVIGGCPACRVGVLEDSFSCLGILCAIAFFPVGILCCLALKTKRCSLCETEF